ncbi:hypothetical protein MHY85_16935, partial [Cellulomonas sp. ACRRI]|uniref:hypothetical protein n=1 Tax=Cellulomonas sp. ACRRI TaxID=2918188 RepID=UPI001EF274CF
MSDSMPAARRTSRGRHAVLRDERDLAAPAAATTPAPAVPGREVGALEPTGRTDARTPAPSGPSAST